MFGDALGVNAAKEVAFEGIHDMAMVHWRGHTCLFLFVTIIRGHAHTCHPRYTKGTHAMPLFYSQMCFTNIG